MGAAAGRNVIEKGGSHCGGGPFCERGLVFLLTNSSEKRCEPLRVGAAAGRYVKE